MSLILNEGTQGPSSGDLMSMSEETTTSAFTRVSHSVGVVPVTASLREETTPTPASSTASDSPPTLRRPPLENEEDDDDEDDRDRHDTSSNQGDNAFAWPSHTSYDEQRQLLGTEEESSDHATSEEEELMMENFPVSAAASNTAAGITASSMMMVSSGKRSVWSITREQINYYTTQFFCLQSDPKGVIPGAEAKEFFERSKLPITELRKIWQLSDVSQDGCLSLEEFLTAMHLVVLKRNTIELPETLPPVLRPAYLKQRLTKRNKLMILQPPVTNPNKDLYNGKDQAVTPSNLEESGNERLLTDEVDATISASTKKSLKSVSSETGNKSEDSVSVISSPGRPAPVNFDFHRPDARRDPTIVQPVAVRLSPDSPVVQSSDLDEEEDQLHSRHHHHPRRKASRGEVGYEKLWNAAGKDDHEDDEENDKVHPGDNLLHESGPVSLPASRLTKKEPSPPPPPPRGSNSYTRSHARSSSLDLNNIQGVHPRPPLPPRIDPSAPTTRLTRDCRALQCKIQEYREKNSVVARTNNELHQEVSDALEERIALEYQLEQLKSFGDE